MKTFLLVTILLTATICSAQIDTLKLSRDTLFTYNTIPQEIVVLVDTTTPSKNGYAKAVNDSSGVAAREYSRGFAARPLIHDTTTVHDTLSSSQDARQDSIYKWVEFAYSKGIPDQYGATSDFYKYFDKLIAATKQYNDPIIRTSLSASALATLTQSFPPSTLILAVSRNANGTTNLTYQTVKP